MASLDERIKQAEAKSLALDARIKQAEAKAKQASVAPADRPEYDRPQEPVPSSTPEGYSDLTAWAHDFLDGLAKPNPPPSVPLPGEAAPTTAKTGQEGDTQPGLATWAKEFAGNLIGMGIGAGPLQAEYTKRLRHSEQAKQALKRGITEIEIDDNDPADRIPVRRKVKAQSLILKPEEEAGIRAKLEELPGPKDVALQAEQDRARRRAKPTIDNAEATASDMQAGVWNLFSTLTQTGAPPKERGFRGALEQGIGTGASLASGVVGGTAEQWAAILSDPKDAFQTDPLGTAMEAIPGVSAVTKPLKAVKPIARALDKIDRIPILKEGQTLVGRAAKAAPVGALLGGDLGSALVGMGAGAILPFVPKLSVSLASKFWPDATPELVAATKRWFIDRAAQSDATATEVVRDILTDPERIRAEIENLAKEGAGRIEQGQVRLVDPTLGDELAQARDRAGQAKDQAESMERRQKSAQVQAEIAARAGGGRVQAKPSPKAQQALDAAQEARKQAAAELEAVQGRAADGASAAVPEGVQENFAVQPTTGLLIRPEDAASRRMQMVDETQGQQAAVYQAQTDVEKARSGWGTPAKSEGEAYARMGEYYTAQRNLDAERMRADEMSGLSDLDKDIQAGVRSATPPADVPVLTNNKQFEQIIDRVHMAIGGDVRIPRTEVARRMTNALRDNALDLLRSPEVRKRVIASLHRREGIFKADPEAVRNLDLAMVELAKGKGAGIGDKTVTGANFAPEQFSPELVSDLIGHTVEVIGKEDPKLLAKVRGEALQSIGHDLAGQGAKNKLDTLLTDQTRPWVPEDPIVARDPKGVMKHIAAKIAKGDKPPLVLSVDPQEMARYLRAIPEELATNPEGIKRLQKFADDIDPATRGKYVQSTVPGLEGTWTTKGFESSVASTLKASAALQEIGGTLDQVLRHAKGNLTARNIPTHLNNLGANLTYQTIRTGMSPAELVTNALAEGKGWLDYQAGKVNNPAKVKMYRALGRTGIFDSSLIEGELGVMSGSVVGNSKVAKVYNKINEKMGDLYKLGDTIFKADEAVRTYNKILDDLGELGQNNHMILDLEGGRTARITRKLDDRIEIVEGGRSRTVKMGDQELADVIGKAAAKPAADIFFRYDEVPLFNQALRKNAVSALASPFFCVPEEYEILTRQGWKHHTELVEGEDVLVSDPVTLETRWEPLQGVAVFDCNEEILSIQRQGREVRFTPEHRWVVRTHDKGVVKVVRGHELNTNHNIITVGQEISASESSMTPDEAALLGWIVTDGHARKHEMVIYQDRDNTKDGVHLLTEIERLAGAKAFPMSPKTNVWGVRVPYEKRMRLIELGYRTIADKHILPTLVGTLSRDAAKAMWQAMWLAEGHSCGHGFGTRYFTQNEGPVMDAFLMLCSMLGIQTSTHRHSVHPNILVCAIRSGKTIRITKKSLQPVKHTGKVWCPKTPSGTWYCRTETEVLWTGNTWAWKSMDVPGAKKGLMSHMLDYDGGGMYQTNDPNLLARNSVSSAATALRRSAMMGALRADMPPDQQELEKAAQFDPFDMGIVAVKTDGQNIYSKDWGSTNVFGQTDLVWKLGQKGLLAVFGEEPLKPTDMQALKVKDPQAYRQARIAQQLWARNKAGLFRPEDAASLAGLQGGLLYRLLSENLMERGVGRKADPGDFIRDFTKLALGGTVASVVDVALGSVDEFGEIPVIGELTSRDKSYDARDDVEPYARWAVRKALGVGWRQAKLEGTTDRYVKNIRMALKRGVLDAYDTAIQRRDKKVDSGIQNRTIDRGEATDIIKESVGKDMIKSTLEGIIDSEIDIIEQELTRETTKGQPRQ